MNNPIESTKMMNEEKKYKSAKSRAKENRDTLMLSGPFSPDRFDHDRTYDTRDEIWFINRL